MGFEVPDTNKGAPLMATFQFEGVAELTSNFHKFPLISPAYMAVSYTHLDVYKRQLPFACRGHTDGA